jgi:uncharacterized damage-inducible protein DinB
MDLKPILLDELKAEMANTRRVLERVPEERMDWQPHAKSMTMSRLASHLAELPGRAVKLLGQDTFDLAPPGATRPAPLMLRERAALLELFDANVRDLRAIVESWTEADLATSWTLLRGGQTLFTATRFAAIRRMLVSHSIHHRGQLTVYLRENDVPLPPLYGPTADEAI